LKWQRLKPYEEFAAMIERHRNGIAAYCRPENKVSLGFVEGLNNKIRVIQRRAYGLCDEEYLRRKVLTCLVPKREGRAHAPAGVVFTNLPPHRVTWLVYRPTPPPARLPRAKSPQFIHSIP